MGHRVTPPEPWLPVFCCVFCWFCLFWLPEFPALPGFPVSFQQFSVLWEVPRQILQRLELAFLMVLALFEEMRLAKEVPCRCDSARIIGMILSGVKSTVPIV